MARVYHLELLNLYYIHVHPTLPILESRTDLDAAIAGKTVPASLLAAIYSMAVFFLEYSPSLRDKAIDRDELQSFVSASVTLEIRKPTLRTVQTLLLYLQLPPLRIREPNHPGSWVVTAQVS